ncbi:MAG: hypothetical protein ACRD13_03830 [Terriglobales bacterium]
MSTVRNIERRMFVRRQLDRDLQAGTGLQAQLREGRGGVEWNGVWTGYLVWAGCEAILLFLVLGIAFSSVNPLHASSWAGVGHGTVIWVAIVTFIATYIGSWVAGRTPPSTTRHGIAKALPFWGLVMLTVVLIVGFVASQAVTVAAGGVAAAGNAAPAAATASITQFQGALQAQGVTVTRAEGANIGAQLAAGNTAGAAATLSRDAGIPLAQAQTALTNVKAGPASNLQGVAKTAGAGVARGAKNVGGSLSWGMFWIALITLGCAIGGGATGGGALSKYKGRRQPAPKPAA